MTNWKTTLGTVMTIIGLIPSGLHLLADLEVPTILMKAGALCAFISFLYTGIQTRDKTV